MSEKTDETNMKKPSETYCVLPFMHLEVSHMGTVKPCCNAKESFKNQLAVTYNVNHHELEEVWNSQDLSDLRTQLLEGNKPSTCSRCWDDERIGIFSKRQRGNEDWKKYISSSPLESPAVIDLKLGNLCNLKCRICSRVSSSKFAAEEFEIFKNFDLSALQNGMRWSQDEGNEFWKHLDQWLPTIEQMDIYGGEPLLSKPHFALLERSVKSGCAGKQSLHYNTNGTVFPKKAVEEIWPHFKSVELMLSIDGLKDQFTYQRHPARWETLEENIDKFKSFAYLKLKVCFTVNAMNVWYVPEFYYWCTARGLSYWINYLHDPDHFRIQIFSDTAKKAIEERLRTATRKVKSNQIEPLISFLWDKPYSQTDRDKFLEQITIYDKHRGESFKDVFPDTYSLLQMT